ncbi:MAG: hypothetical protein PHP44_13145 [Kiritimatiellae bacterium]|nr:hypothetical protein [Kiritimatiellia bacterium]
MIGKTAEFFSNGWKNRRKSFQRLEKSGKKFPMVGKLGGKFPMVGKTADAPREERTREKKLCDAMFFCLIVPFCGAVP